MINNVNQSQRLIKHIIRSFARLAENHRVRSILKQNLPSILKEKSFQQSLDESSRRWLQNIFKHLSSNYASSRSNSDVQKIENGPVGRNSSSNLNDQGNFGNDFKGNNNFYNSRNFDGKTKDEEYFDNQ